MQIFRLDDYVVFCEIVFIALLSMLRGEPVFAVNSAAFLVHRGLLSQETLATLISFLLI